MKPSEICLKAKEVLMDRGWWQGGYREPNGRRVCVVEALVVADGGSTTTSVLKAVADVVGCPLAAWNDMKGRTVDEVLAALDKAAAQLQAEGR